MLSMQLHLLSYNYWYLHITNVKGGQMLIMHRGRRCSEASSSKSPVVLFTKTANLTSLTVTMACYKINIKTVVTCTEPFECR